jgi:hypothetical protein
MKILLLTLLLLSSCSKWFDVKSGNGQMYVSELTGEVFDLSVDKWSVGKDREIEVSKGFSFKVKIPKIKPKNAKKLFKKSKANAWIFRVTKIIRGSKNSIGHVLYDLENLGSVTDSISIFVYYHAAAMSSEFRRAKCPAFQHSKKIVDINLISTGTKPTQLFANRRTSYTSSTMERPSFTPIIFSGDKSLTGKYLIELALYNTKDKDLVSKWMPMNKMIEVESEIDIRIPSCNGVNTEDIINKRQSN